MNLKNNFYQSNPIFIWSFLFLRYIYLVGLRTHLFSSYSKIVILRRTKITKIGSAIVKNVKRKGDSDNCRNYIRERLYLFVQQHLEQQ